MNDNPADATLAGDPYDLERFVRAQNPVYDRVVSELRAGQKRTHWMWFVFPQLAGLGRSEMAQRFGIASAREATAYLTHPILGERLRQCTQLVVAIDGRTIGSIFGSPDDRKFSSSMTLFAAVADGDDARPFVDALDRYFDGARDEQTCELLRRRA
jgi:uncharacterized protein (DUF1810 family)